MAENNMDYDEFGVEEYLLEVGLSKKEINEFPIKSHGIYVLLVKAISLKQLSLTDVCNSDDADSQSLKKKVSKLYLESIRELKEKYNYEFDEEILKKHCY